MHIFSFYHSQEPPGIFASQVTILESPLASTLKLAAIGTAAPGWKSPTTYKTNPTVIKRDAHGTTTRLAITAMGVAR